MHTTSDTAADISLAATLSARIRLVATTCCVCSTPLADATSVELGIGPTCRKRLAKLDGVVAASPDWDAVSDALADFAATDRADTDRLALFETAMEQIVLARSGADHKLANLITHYIAATQARRASIGGLILAIERMGRPNLADALRKRQYPVRIEVVGDMLYVFSPFEESFKTAMWRQGLGRWDRDQKCYVVPGSREADLLVVLGGSYLGLRAIGPDGEFTIARATPVREETPKPALTPGFAGRTGRDGDIGYIHAGPHAGKRGLVFWQSADKSRVGVKACSCKSRCNHEPMWCNARDVSTEPQAVAVRAA
jgi:hypothetical protein